MQRPHDKLCAPAPNECLYLLWPDLLLFFLLSNSENIFFLNQLRTQIVNGTCANGKFTNWQREREKTRNGSRRDDVKKLPF
jgi:hypothetical protein